MLLASIVIAGGGACILIVWTAMVIGRIDCHDELSEAGYSDWPLTREQRRELGEIVEKGGSL